MILNLRGRHFKNTKYVVNCAIEKAVKEIFPKGSLISESVDSLLIDSKYYPHERYTKEYFSADQEKAKTLGYNDKIIRKIIIPGLDKPKLANKSKLVKK